MKTRELSSRLAPTNLPMQGVYFVLLLFLCVGVTAADSREGLPFTYEADKASAAIHRDTQPPSLLGDGKWRDASYHCVQYDGNVTLIADLGSEHQLKKVHVLAYQRRNPDIGDDFEVKSVTVYLSSDRQRWEQAAVIENKRLGEALPKPWGPVELTAWVSGRARYVKFAIEKSPDVHRVLLGEIVIEGDSWDAPGPDPYADEVVSWIAGNPASSEGLSDPSYALGAPNYIDLPPPRNLVEPWVATLGSGGQLVVRFVDNHLINGEGADLRIYEAGTNESFAVEISVDGTKWIDLGTGGGGTVDFDIAEKAKEGTHFYFVRITDLRSVPGGTRSGADIDAVEALNVLLPIKSDDEDDQIRVERQEGLVMGLKIILKSLGLEDGQYLADKVFWQEVADGVRFFTLDTARLEMMFDSETQARNTSVRWYLRHGTGGTWQPLGSGREIRFRIPDRIGPLQLYGEATIRGNKRETEPLTFTVEKSVCQGFYQQVLTQMADAIYFFRQITNESKGTYGEDWAKKNGGTAPRTVLMAPDPATGKPYEFRSGDVVIRTAGPFSKVLGTLGSPDSPQTHSGIIEVKVVSLRQKVHLVHQVVADGYGVVPLTPADARLYEKMQGLPAEEKLPSYLEEATLNTVAVYRPSASVFDGVKGYSPFPMIGIDVAGRVKQVKKKVKGYDFAFMESSTLSGEDPFKGLYYCHEFVKEVLGIGQDAPPPALLAAKLQGFDTNAGALRHVERLARFWESAFACDREAAEERAARTAAHGPGTLSQLLSDVDLDTITFDEEDPNKDAEVRKEIRDVIKILRSFLDHNSLRNIITEAVVKGVAEKTAPVKSAADKASDFAADVSELAGVPKEYTPLVSVGLRAVLRSWIAMGDHEIAEYLVDELIEDLGNVIGTRQLLQGGFARSEDGRTLFITFDKISQ